MRQRIILASISFAFAALGGIVTYKFTHGQPPPKNDSGPVRPAVFNAPAESGASATRRSSANSPSHDLTKMSASTRRLYLSARAGAEWLLRADNSANGRFLPGWNPALGQPLDRDDYLHQCGATYALAKAARYFGDERYLMKARQAILSLLADTKTDANDPTSRCTSLPTIMVNPLAADGMLLMAIHELQNPADDLLKTGEELAQFIRKQQQPDGSFRLGDAGEGISIDKESSRVFPGMALYGLVLSQRNRPASWKRESALKAIDYYRRQWKTDPWLSAAAWLTLACAECYVQAPDRKLADYIFEMCDWVCTQQYGPNSSNPKWIGGFMGRSNGKSVLSAPTIDQAPNLEAMAAACLVTRHVPDAQRYAKYREALAMGAEFLISLQFGESNTLHFTPGYRTAVIGGFHPSHGEGRLRIDYNQHAVCSLIQYITCAGLK
jgi:hypothetical protein